MSTGLSTFTKFGAPFAVPAEAAEGHELIKLHELGFVPHIAGGAKGFNVEADTFQLTQTADGRDLNDLWSEFSRVVSLHNAERQRIIDFLTFSVTNVIEDVPNISTDDFEEASEFGVPKAIRGDIGYFSMAYDFKWYDLAARFTWKFLAEATAGQVQSIHQSALEADNRLIFRRVMETLFRPTNRNADIKGQPYTVYALYNGDGTIPPEYKGRTFDGTESHYMVSGNTVIDSGDLEDILDKLVLKGYSTANGVEHVILLNPAQVKEIRRFRANEVNNNGAVALYDFVPASNQPALIVPNEQGLLGDRLTQSTVRGLNVVGSYGSAIIVEEDYIPAGYIVLIGTGGAASLQNPIGIREHANPGLRGLRQIPGRDSTYPLIDSYYSRGFGTGIRQRGGAAIMQLKASGSYEAPAQYR